MAEEKKGFFGTIKAGFKGAVDGVTYPIRKADEAVNARADVLHKDRNDGWAKVAEAGAAVTGTIDGTARGAVVSGGQPAGAAFSGGSAAISEAIDLKNGQNPVLRELEKKGYGSRENLEKEYEQFKPHASAMPPKDGKGPSLFGKLKDGMLGRGDDEKAPSAFRDFKEAGGNMSEWKKSKDTLDEYVDRKRDSNNSQQHTDGGKKEDKHNKNFAQPNLTDATQDTKKQIDNKSDIDSLAQVDTSNLNMSHDNKTPADNLSYSGASTQIAQSNTVQV